MSNYFRWFLYTFDVDKARELAEGHQRDVVEPKTFAKAWAGWPNNGVTENPDGSKTVNVMAVRIRPEELPDHLPEDDKPIIVVTVRDDQGEDFVFPVTGIEEAYNAANEDWESYPVVVLSAEESEPAWVNAEEIRDMWKWNGVTKRAQAATAAYDDECSKQNFDYGDEWASASLMADCIAHAVRHHYGDPDELLADARRIYKERFQEED